MQKITMTSDQFRGSLVFNYNEVGQLTRLDIDAELTEKQKSIITTYLPWTRAAADGFMDTFNTAKYIIEAQELTFEMFWKRYDDKARSSKKKTESQWNKMSKTEQAKAYLFIPKYFRNKGTAEKKYATTYLSDELWNN